MWWSIRRQVSHIAWVFLAVMRRRCHTFLWPDGNIPTPIRWEDHSLPNMKSDRRLDEERHWSVDDLLDKVRLGSGWAAQVRRDGSGGNPASHSVRASCYRILAARHPGTAARGQHRTGRTRTAFAPSSRQSLWMLYWEVVAHLFTIQRLKQAQGLPARIAIPRTGYLTLPEYTGESEHAAPGFVPLT